MTCAEWVRNRREELDLTQSELAELSDVSEEMIDDIESELCPVPFGIKRKLEKVLGSYLLPPAKSLQLR